MNINDKSGWNLMHSYTNLPNDMFTDRRPTPVKEPVFIILNKALCHTLGLNPTYLTPDYFSGNSLVDASRPIAQAYAGHQFGHFTVLGDGRAILLGEQNTPDNLIYDIQLKGAGPTRYSRAGDGRATLSSMLREYIISEAIYHLNIPTTRSLAVVSTGEQVLRERSYKGGILTRVSLAHIRVGTFQYAAMKGHVKALADYTIERLYPTCKDAENPYIALLDHVINRQAELIALWQSVGFIHGVMNTDNMSVAGETIDYGPCAFMDEYHKNTIFSSIDQGGRYAYSNQPILAQWNLARFAETLLPLIHENSDKAISLAEELINNFMTNYTRAYYERFKHKLGMDHINKSIIDELLEILEKNQMDFTNTFVNLSNPEYDNPHLSEWLIKWRKEVIDYQVMKKVNPQIIPRNHMVDQALKDAEAGDLELFNTLLKALQKPFEQATVSKFTLPPSDNERIKYTYCGT